MVLQSRHESVFRKFAETLIHRLLCRPALTIRKIPGSPNRTDPPFPNDVAVRLPRSPLHVRLCGNLAERPRPLSRPPDRPFPAPAPFSKISTPVCFRVWRRRYFRERNGSVFRTADVWPLRCVSTENKTAKCKSQMGLKLYSCRGNVQISSVPVFTGIIGISTTHNGNGGWLRLCWLEIEGDGLWTRYYKKKEFFNCLENFLKITVAFIKENS